MNHIQNTMRRKQAASEAGNKEAAYSRYRRLAEVARSQGYSTIAIIDELEFEKQKVKDDIRGGDAIFQQGLTNAKSSCLYAISLLISELKQEIEN